jgi:hypothetical protein
MQLDFFSALPAGATVFQISALGFLLSNDLKAQAPAPAILLLPLGVQTGSSPLRSHFRMLPIQDVSQNLKAIHAAKSLFETNHLRGLHSVRLSYLPCPCLGCCYPVGQRHAVYERKIRIAAVFCNECSVQFDRVLSWYAYTSCPRLLATLSKWGSSEYAGLWFAMPVVTWRD